VTTVTRSVGVAALLGLAIVSIVAALSLRRPVQVEEAGHSSAIELTTIPVSPDAGSLDTMIDAIHIEHGLNHGR